MYYKMLHVIASVLVVRADGTKAKWCKSVDMTLVDINAQTFNCFALPIVLPDNGF